MARLSLKSAIRFYDFIGIEDGKFVFRRVFEGKPTIIKRDLKKLLFLASGILFLSAVIDTILWWTMLYMVPSWTIALMSAAMGALTLILVYARISFQK
ncbi:MAG: hypothetical protein QXH91_06010 [Candidatus Bathyarchaeia archaeon]